MQNKTKIWFRFTVAYLIICMLLPLVTLNANALSFETTPLTVSYGSTKTDGNKLYTSSGTFKASSVTTTFTYPSTYSSDIQVTIGYTNITRPSNKIGQTSSVIVNGQTVTAAGSQTIQLSPGGSFTIVINAVSGSYTASIEISELSIVEVKTANIGFAAGENGSYTASYNGSEITLSDYIGQDNTLTVNSTSPITLTAGNASSTDYSFYAWVLETTSGVKLLSTSETASVKLDTNGTVYPIFLRSADVMYQVNGYLYDTWNAAFTAAGTSYPVILAKSGTLSAGTYTISSGQKLLIPYSSANIANFGAPTVTTTTGTNTAYRTLTLSSGTIINCDGGMICVNAEQRSDVHNTGYVAGQYGHIKTVSGSEINLSNGAKMYAYGYVSGDGKVSAASGTEVHELIHLPGWRGGSVSSNLLTKHNSGNFNSLIFVNYYIQNVLCNLEVYGGAAAVLHGTIAPDGAPTAFAAPLIAPAGFQLDGKEATPQFVLSSDGVANRKYDSSTDRMVYTIKSGTLETSGMTMTMEDMSVDTSNFIFPLDSSMTLQINSGAEFIISTKMKLLPESKLIVDPNATCTVSGSLFVYDADQWLGDHKYALIGNGGSDTATYMAVSKLPSEFKTFTGRTITNDATLQVDGLLDVTSTSGNVYSSASGGNICGTGRIKFGSGVSTAEFAVHECYGREKLIISYEAQVDSVPFYPAITNLAGFSAKDSMGANATYYGTGDYWYNYLVKAVNSEGTTAADLVSVNGTAAGSSSTDNKVIGYYAYNNAGTQSTFTFTVDDSACQVSLQDGTSEDTALTNNDGTYTLSGITADTTIVLTSHDMTPTAAKDPSCTEDGNSAYYSCSTCGSFFSDAEGGTAIDENSWIIPAAGHTEVTDDAVNATCTETGLTAGSHCSVCNTVLTAQEEVPAAGHTPGDAATCTTAQTCTVCGETLQAALGHSFSNELVDGMYIRTCSVCNTEVTEYPVELKSMSLWTDGEVGLWLKVAISDILLAQDGACIVVTEEGNEIEDEQVTKYTMAQLTAAGPDSNGRYVLKQSIASGEMTGDVTITAFLADETPLCIGDYKEGIDFLDDTDPYSVTRTVIDYVRLVLAADSSDYANLQAMVTAMVTYGGYAQTYFGVDTENLAYNVLDNLPDISDVSIDQVLTITSNTAAATASLSEPDDTTETEPTETEAAADETTPDEATEAVETEPEETEAAAEETEAAETQEETASTESTGGDATAYTSDVGISPMSVASADETESSAFGLEYASQTVTLDSKISLKTYFTIAEGASASIADYTFTYTRTDSDETGSLTPMQSGDRYYVLIENIPVAYWDAMYDITVTSIAGDTYVVTSSVLAWVKRCLESTSAGEALNNLARAMYLYNQAANDNFGK